MTWIFCFLTPSEVSHCFLFFFFYLFGNLTKVADVSQHHILDDGVLGILPVSLSMSIEVRMECVHALYCSGSLLLVPKNQVDPQVEMGANIVTFQSLEEEMQALKTKTKNKVTFQTTLHAKSKTQLLRWKWYHQSHR